jgi:uncharacterized surface protein with fasciclin (FAS1) repeats
MKKLFALAVALLLTPLAFAADEKKADAAKAEKTIVETAAGNEDFSTLVAAVKAAGLAETLGTGEYTVFAPTNAAFKAVGDAKVQDLLKDKEKLTAVLKAHVVKGSVMSSALKDGMEVETLDGSKFKVSIKDKDVSIGGAKVSKADIKCKNGVVHVIDAVLMPNKK